MSLPPRATGRHFVAMALCAILINRLIDDRALGQCHYTHQFILPPPDGQYLDPTAINNRGHAAGIVDGGRGFVWTPEAGTQVMPVPPGVIRMQATGINDLDHVCGWMDWSTYEVTAFLWDGSEYTIIPSPYPNTRIEAEDVNNRDQVVGRIIGAPDQPLRAFIWENGVLTELNTLIEVPQPRMVAINDDGLMIGYAGLGANYHAWALDGGGVEWLPENALAVTAANGLSNSGIIVGYGSSEPNGSANGCVWEGPALHQIPPPADFATRSVARSTTPAESSAITTRVGLARAAPLSGSRALLTQSASL